MGRGGIMSRRHEIQQHIKEEKLSEDAKLTKRILELRAEDLYHIKGIAKTLGISYRKVRETIRDHNDRNPK